MSVALSPLNRTIASTEDNIYIGQVSEGPDESTISLQAIPQTIVESLITSKDLTLNEKVVIFSIGACLTLHIAKSKLCPNSWASKDAEL